MAPNTTLICTRMSPYVAHPVRLAATTALYNALEFAHTNFDNEQERNYLMQVCDDDVG